MSIAGLVTALLVGVAIGLLGRLIIPGRQEAPIWLSVSVTVVAALAGSVVARLTGVDTSTLNLLTLVIQVGLAGIGVVLVVATARPDPSDSPGNRRRRSASTRGQPQARLGRFPFKVDEE
ncbi:hypothetical protein AB0F49_24165 [Micromonospora ureilytica]|uniref:hypothetical protein n=1 Tax=Micromonospora ureilytica TaxID=709868 RepID=UPI0033FE4BFC